MLVDDPDTLAEVKAAWRFASEALGRDVRSRSRNPAELGSEMRGRTCAGTLVTGTGIDGRLTVWSLRSRIARHRMSVSLLGRIMPRPPVFQKRQAKRGVQRRRPFSGPALAEDF